MHCRGIALASKIKRLESRKRTRAIRNTIAGVGSREWRRLCGNCDTGYMWAIRRSIDAGSVRQECFWREQGLGHTSTYIRARKLTRAKMCSHQRFYQFLGLRRKQVQPFYNFIHFHHSSFSYIILHLARAPPSAIAWIHRTSSAAQSTPALHFLELSNFKALSTSCPQARLLA